VLFLSFFIIWYTGTTWGSKAVYNKIHVCTVFLCFNSVIILRKLYFWTGCKEKPYTQRWAQI